MKSPRSRRGATLLVTLGIMSVLGVMVVAFLITSRLHRQVAASQQHRLAARNHIDEGLHFALKMVEESFTYPNYTGAGTDMPDNAYLTKQRVAPVGHWFAKEYAITNEISRDIAFQAKDVLASPASSNGPTVNLLSPKVLGLVPAALTNGLQLSLDKKPVFRSGWQALETIGNDDLTLRLNATQVRVAFTVFNCSGFLDANHFVSGSTTQKLPRVCFSQADVTNWLQEARSDSTLSDRFEPLDDVLTLNDPNEAPFFHLSYDPGPDLYPLHYDCFETCPALGTFAFGSGLNIDLNTPLISQVLRGAAALTQNDAPNKIRFSKYNLNSVTNFFQLGTQSTDTTDTTAPWFNDANFKARWLDTVVYLLNMMRNEESDANRYKWNDSPALAWTIANFMDEDRIPQVTDFPTADAEDPVISTRANYAVEDVPLINKVSIFSIFDPEQPGKENPDLPEEVKKVGLNYYFDKQNTTGLSNHYAVAVELWYPFAPNEPPPNSACYVGIYTNEADVVTTTNRPWTGNELRDWFRWNTVDSSNTVMQTLFTQWGEAYLGDVGYDTTNHPLWQVVSYQDDLWFTPAMTNHPYWPVPETNGTVNLAATPIWQAFFPDTFIVVTTNGSVITTNVFTYYTTTNSAGETVYVTPLPMTAAQSNSLLALFAMLPTNSTKELYDYLLLRPDDFEDWEKLVTYFNEYPTVMNSLLPANAEPTLGFMTEKDRHELWPEAEPGIVNLDVTYAKTTKDFRGYFWTVYPKQTISFVKVDTEDTSTSQGGSSAETVTTTNYYAIGDFIPGKKEPNTIWVRPVVTIIPAGGNADTPPAPSQEEEGAATADVIVDEALLTYKDDSAEHKKVPVWGWTSVTNLCIPDPRQNAYAKDWRYFPNGEKWEDVIKNIELNTGVKELPFIHFNKPFTSIGDIGYIYASYTNSENVATSGEMRPYDTVTFSTRSGAALLDIFTLHPTNAPMRGLVQANTEQRPVIKALYSDVSVGWTNSVGEGLQFLRILDNKLDKWADLYTDALTNAPYSMGWRSFADMMPNLSSNKTLYTENVWSGASLHPMHDYTEDVLRGLVDKVSFRQNVFVIIVAAQALSPASTPLHPVVLADQRAAVTVLRDAYTGRWMIYDWTWLTE